MKESGDLLLSEGRPLLDAAETDKHINEERRMPLSASGVLITFKSKNLEELCEIANKMYQLLAALRPYGAYDLHAIYDEDTRYWTGFFEE
ncbi:MAG TPA: hypothetical protein VEG28_05595 [Dehalococcoidia bacterium]|nr:hypothetical protein [Dehalococcoidia bacterium]